MFNAQTESNILEERYTHELLAYLLNNGTQRKTTLARAVSKSSTINSKINLLEKAGFIDSRTDRFDKNTKWVGLTPVGEKVAKTLCELDATIRDHGKAKSRTDRSD
jgi:DNA-binding MarR family transcriptional regulator